MSTVYTTFNHYSLVSAKQKFQERGNPAIQTASAPSLLHSLECVVHMFLIKRQSQFLGIVFNSANVFQQQHSSLKQMNPLFKPWPVNLTKRNTYLMTFSLPPLLFSSSPAMSPSVESGGDFSAQTQARETGHKLKIGRASCRERV